MKSCASIIGRSKEVVLIVALMMTIYCAVNRNYVGRAIAKWQDGAEGYSPPHHNMGAAYFYDKAMEEAERRSGTTQ